MSVPEQFISIPVRIVYYSIISIGFLAFLILLLIGLFLKFYFFGNKVDPKNRLKENFANFPETRNEANDSQSKVMVAESNRKKSDSVQVNENLPSEGLNKLSSYRMEQETIRIRSSEYTRRGQLWSQHASWHLPNAPRQATAKNSFFRIYGSSQGLGPVKAILQKYDVDLISGFLPAQDPIQRLPYARYHIWEDLADDLPKLLGARLGQAREPLQQLPLLSTDKLVTDAELRRAHLLLCLFAHAYVWGGNTPLDRLPAAIAVPLCEVSNKLQIPPVLGHPSIVLYNWRRLDIDGDICMENLATLNNFFDGRDESWFYLITVEIEAKGAAAIVPMMLAIDAIQRHNEELRVISAEEQQVSTPRGGRIFGQWTEDTEKSLRHYISCASSLTMENLSDDSDDSCPANEDNIFVNDALTGELNPWRVAAYATAQLKLVSKAIEKMTKSLSSMREGCHPFIFYHRVRPFLSGWKHNPTMPSGLIYEGVSDAGLYYYGGSAAQSALLPFLDICLGVDHENTKSRDFLVAMRDYMIAPHRQFLSYLEGVACIRPFVEACMRAQDKFISEEDQVFKLRSEIVHNLRSAYDECVIQLQHFRTGHISLVAEYIMAQQKQQGRSGSLESSAGGKGTGGTELMSFLKPLRDDCTNKVLAHGDSVRENVAKDDVSIQKHLSVEQRADFFNATPVSGTNIELERDSSIYLKDNGRIEDIDLFRGACKGVKDGQWDPVI